MCSMSYILLAPLKDVCYINIICVSLLGLRDCEEQLLCVLCDMSFWHYEKTLHKHYVYVTGGTFTTVKIYESHVDLTMHLFDVTQQS